MLPEQAGGDVVVAIGEDGGGDGDAIAEEAARGEEAAVDLGLDLFDDDSLTAFGRFHFVPFPRVHCIFIVLERGRLSPIVPLAASYRSAGCINPKSSPFSPYDRLRGAGARRECCASAKLLRCRLVSLGRQSLLADGARVQCAWFQGLVRGGSVPGGRSRSKGCDGNSEQLGFTQDCVRPRSFSFPGGSDRLCIRGPGPGTRGACCGGSGGERIRARHGEDGCRQHTYDGHRCRADGDGHGAQRSEGLAACRGQHGPEDGDSRASSATSRWATAFWRPARRGMRRRASTRCASS